jgi:hypothetical protein
MDKKIALDKKLAIAMCVSIAILLLVIIIMAMSRDTTGPGIRIDQSKMQYVYGSDDDKLLLGVTALDATDGDVTDTVTVEKRVLLSAGKMEVVKYAACDNSGNVTFMEVLLVSEEHGAYKILPSENYSVDYDTLTVTIKGTNVSGKVENAIIDMNNTKADEETSQEVTTDNNTEDVTTEESTTKKQEETTTKKQEETTTKKQEETTKPATNAKPVMTLKQSEITINAGDRINWVSYIKDITDDIDSRDTLFRKVYLTKEIDTSIAGDVTQGLYCTDSNGNRSETVYILIHIQ